MFLEKKDSHVLFALNFFGCGKSSVFLPLKGKMGWGSNNKESYYRLPPKSPCRGTLDPVNLDKFCYLTESNSLPFS